MPSTVRVSHNFNPRVLADVKQSPGLQRDMARRGTRVLTAARQRLGSNPKRIDTGRLRASIGLQVVIVDGSWAARIFTNVEYAIYVHEGTRYMQANPFLRDGLRAAGE